MDKTFNKKLFGSKLRALRKNHSLTQQDLSNKTGFSQNTISNWENGNREPDSIGDLVKLADSLSVPVSYFVDNSIDPVSDWRTDFNIPEFMDPPFGDFTSNLKYFSDKPELFDIYRQIHDNEQLQQLFNISKDLTPIDLETVLMVARGIKKERGQE